MKESKMMNDSKLQLMYLMILFELSIAQITIFMTFSLLFQKYLQMQRTRLAINNKEETGNQEETAIIKIQNCTKILLG